MKISKFSTLLLTLSLTASLTPTFAQIPNAGFENWKTTSVFGKNITDPEGWSTGNLMQAFDGGNPSAVKTTDAYEGSFALKLTNQPNNASMPAMMNTLTDPDTYNDRFPVNGKITSIRGYYKYAYANQDTFSISLLLYRNGMNIGSANFESNAAKSTYTLFTADVFYSDDSIPDSASISAFAGTFNEFKAGTELTLDAITLVGMTTGNAEFKPELVSSAAVFPNPVNDHATIEFEQLTAGAAMITTTDILGNEVQVISASQFSSAGRHSINWDASALKPGVYFISVRVADSVKTIKAFVNR